MNKDGKHLQNLIDAYLNGSLGEADGALLNQMLDDSHAARDQFRECVAFHDSLYEHFSDEGDILGFELAKAEVQKPRFPFAWIAAAAALIVATISFWQTGEDAPIATLLHGTETSWVTESDQDFHPGWHELEYGLAVLQVGDDVRLAIEGPARFKLQDEMHMTVEYGKISAEVGESGHGFTIETPEGRIIDLGTRFGIQVKKTGETEAHVFEGTIDVENDGETRRLSTDQAVRMKGLANIGSDSLSFPMPGREAIEIPQSGDFGTGTQLGEGMPTTSSVWGGDHCDIISLPGGRTALEFIAPHSRSEVSKSQLVSEMWQLLELNEIAEDVHQGTISAKLRASFNQTASGKPTHFQIHLVAFRGQLSRAEEYWDRKNEPTSERLTQTSATLLADDDAASWEPLEVTLHVPRGTDFLLVSVLAKNGGEETFSGRFADEVTINFSSQPRSSVPKTLWDGETDDWNRAENWLSGKPDMVRDRIVIAGEQEAVISSKVQSKQDFIIALHRNSTGKLRIAPGGQLAKSGYGNLNIGFNPGAEAELIVEGSLETRGRVFIGRNNARSLVDLAGGTWNAGDGMIRMSQYGHYGADTESKLRIRKGGKLRAATLEMVHDLTELHLVDGKVELENLRIGGDDGQALVRLSGGELKVDNLFFGPGNGTLRFESQTAKLLLHGSWTAEQLLAMPAANWQVGENAASTQDFALEPRADFTQIQLLTESSNQ